MLNDRLYASLVKKFGAVKVSNAGRRRIERQIPDPIHAGRFISQKSDPGEHYRVCCPKCGDRRYRLYISYLWNTKDSAGKTVGRSLIHCFNCPANTDYSDFSLILSPYIKYMPTIVRKASDAIADDTKPLKEVSMPGKCVSLLDLPNNHPAIRYLIEERKFDPQELHEEWGVQYCVEHKHPFIRDRLVIPVKWEGKLVGWQTRAIGKDQPVKYFTMPGLAKSALLFNGDKAKQFPFGVVVEGVFDAFRVGPRAVALLGKSMSYKQQQYVQGWWGRGAVCLMLDPDAIEDMEYMLRLLGKRAYRWGSFAVTLPAGKDPDEFAREEVWGLITARARAEGVPLVGLP